VRRRLEVWAKALLRGRRYTIAFDTNIDAALQNSHKRLIVVNPEAFGHTPWQQYMATRALLAHEVGHVLFTGDLGEGAVRALANSLEDERVERCMVGNNPQLAPLFDFAGDLAWAESSPLPLVDSPWPVLGACLLWRWEHDLELPQGASRIQLTPTNQEMWDHIRPWVEAAWMAETSDQVVVTARRILAYLGIPEEVEVPDWLKRLLEALDRAVSGGENSMPSNPIAPRGQQQVGGRAGGPRAPQSAPAEGIPGLSHECNEPAGRGRSKHPIFPAPYAGLVREVQADASRLVEELKIPQRETRVEPVESGGRYSYRQEMRTPDTPFLALSAPGREPPKAVFGLVVDRTGSMDWGNKIQQAKKGLMMLHLAMEELQVPHRIACFEDNVVLKEFDERSERVKALIAGLEGVSNHSRIAPTLEPMCAALQKRPELIKVCLVIHDGRPSDETEVKELVARYSRQPGFYVLGVYLETPGYAWGQEERETMKLLFGARLIACLPEELPDKFGNVLRAFIVR
jgi:hypothetical protein